MFEIYADFSKCRGESKAREYALRTERADAAFWTSVEPRRPVGQLYTLEDIESIRDDEKDYEVYP